MAADTSQQQSRYSYSPLRDGEIRLLRMLLDNDGAVRGDLRTFPLARHPKYAAVSYVWGAPAFSWSITVDGCKLLMLRALEPLVRMLCAREDARGVWWWIDAVCIDMHDPRERSAQVLMMGRIYRAARRTVVWLGERSADSDRALEVLERLSRNWALLEGLAIPTPRSAIVGVFGDLLGEQGAGDWAAVEGLLARPWWTRVWTLQEYVLSPRLKFYCGASSVPRATLSAALYAVWVLDYSGWDSGTNGTLLGGRAFNPAWNRCRLLQWLARSRRKAYGVGSGISLVAMLAYFSDHCATDYRDRIYSLLGLAADADLVERVDYEACVGEVYSGLVEAFVLKHRSLDIVCFAHVFNSHADARAETLPSWVPDWRAKAEPNVVPLMVSQSGRTHIGNLRPLHSLDASAVYSASETRLPQVQFDRPGQIVCDGILLDVIDGLGCVSREDPSSHGAGSDSMIQSTSTINTSPMIEEMRTKDAHDLLTQIARCLVLDRKDRYLRHAPLIKKLLEAFQLFYSTTIIAPSQVHSLFRDWYSSNSPLKIRGLELDLHCKKAARLTKSDHADLFDRSDWESFLSRFRDTTMTMARRLMITNRGFVGMAPFRAIKNDVVCVLFGCSIPVLLRKRVGKDEYEFIGECYVNGFMNGEALGQGPEAPGPGSLKSFLIS